MKKITIIGLVLLLSAAAFGQKYSGGSGSSDSPYQISTANDWLELISTSEDWDKHFVLINDLDLLGAPLMPVGEGDFDEEWNYILTPFNGVFNGQGYVISNVVIDMWTESFAGLFGVIGENGQVINLGIEGGEVSGIMYVGGLVGYNYGIIESCYFSGSVYGDFSVGGLVGENDNGTITSSHAIGSVELGERVGGLVGRNWEGTIESCYFSGSVYGDNSVGGLVGYNYGIIESCYFSGSVYGVFSVGGLVGDLFQGSVLYSYAKGPVTGSHWDIGGLIGSGSSTDNTVTSSFWDTDTSGQTESAGGTGKTTAEMKTMSTFTEAGWDFLGESDNGTDDVWRMCQGGVDYPRLRWEFSRTGDLDCPDGVGLEDLGYLCQRWLWDNCEALNHCDWADINQNGVVNMNDFVILAANWLDGAVPAKPDITWVYINNSGFNGDMSRYQTTNYNFAHYLNDALASGDIIVDDNNVVGNSGPYSGENYYDLDGVGYTWYGATHGGASRINYSNGEFTVDSGFESHPVTHVSWYGSTAFAEYYGWRLPTTGEWQAVASFDGEYTYGCGNTINEDIGNYRGSRNTHGTTPVGQYGLFGYGMADMAGNVWEWTSSLGGGSQYQYARRGGTWYSPADDCTVSNQTSSFPSNTTYHTGFRVCR